MSEVKGCVSGRTRTLVDHSHHSKSTLDNSFTKSNVFTGRLMTDNNKSRIYLGFPITFA
ncbi:MAG: hypothetical protein OXC03_02895 [Flavobacteriaceae bacterium]|nr:hypothetical protein [Flavobacteriaceae bacterium]